jgi:response regulator RpfG family c-di-GMP phosphodiesterase
MIGRNAPSKSAALLHDVGKLRFLNMILNKGRSGSRAPSSIRMKLRTRRRSARKILAEIRVSVVQFGPNVLHWPAHHERAGTKPAIRTGCAG